MGGMFRIQPGHHGGGASPQLPISSRLSLRPCSHPRAFAHLSAASCHNLLPTTLSPGPSQRRLSCSPQSISRLLGLPGPDPPPEGTVTNSPTSLSSLPQHLFLNIPHPVMTLFSSPCPPRQGASLHTLPDIPVSATPSNLNLHTGPSACKARLSSMCVAPAT